MSGAPTKTKSNRQGAKSAKNEREEIIFRCFFAFSFALFALRGWICFASILIATLPADAQLSKGDRLLLKYGLQMQGMVTDGDVFHIGTYQEIGYTSIDLFSAAAPRQARSPGGLWSRWVSDLNHMPPQANELPYMRNLIALELGDELNLNDDKIRGDEIDWFNAARDRFPETILYTNNFGGQVSDKALGDFISRAKPDMLFFDTYPWQSDYGSSPGDARDTPIAGVPINWLSELRRYRQWAMASYIPFGTYMQTFHAVEDYDKRVYRDPSPSELRFNNSAALAFNAKFLTGFTYNTGASSLFTKPGGDTHPTVLFAEQKDTNRRDKNLGKALVYLKPVPDLHNPNDENPPAGPASAYKTFPDGTTTSILILKNDSDVAAQSALPIGFQDDPPLPKAASWWEAGKNDPYLNGWSVKNLGPKNARRAGMVLISWFTPLDDSFEGARYPGEVYMMVVNGLTDPTGPAGNCAQEIKLNFVSSIPGIEVLDPETGKLTPATLTKIGGAKVQFDFTLSGGYAILFKFDDGAPFVGVEHR